MSGCSDSAMAAVAREELQYVSCPCKACARAFGIEMAPANLTSHMDAGTVPLGISPQAADMSPLSMAWEWEQCPSTPAGVGAAAYALFQPTPQTRVFRPRDSMAERAELSLQLLGDEIMVRRRTN